MLFGLNYIHFVDMLSWSKSCENSFCSNYNYNNEIRTQICICHDSSAVMICVKLWPDCVIIFFKENRNIYKIWITSSIAHKSLVRWLPNDVDLIKQNLLHCYLSYFPSPPWPNFLSRVLQHLLKWGHIFFNRPYIFHNIYWDNKIKTKSTHQISFLIPVYLQNCIKIFKWFLESRDDISKEYIISTGISFIKWKNDRATSH